MFHPLTVIIPCKNERDHLAACVASAKQLAADVLVADSGSTDGSLEIARALGCRVIEREYRTSGDFKNWAIPQAANPWVLILDADERITPELAAEISRVLERPKHDGYRIRRRNHFLGHPIRFGPWRNDDCLRLFRRDAGRYVGPTDHAEVVISTGKVGWLVERMIHYTCTSYDQYLPKLQRYAAVQAALWHQAGRHASPAQMLFRGPLRFFQGYVWRLGFLDGLAGLQVCASDRVSLLPQTCAAVGTRARQAAAPATGVGRDSPHPVGRLSRRHNLPNCGKSKRRNAFSVRAAGARFTGLGPTAQMGGSTGATGRTPLDVALRIRGKLRPPLASPDRSSPDSFS